MNEITQAEFNERVRRHEEWLATAGDQGRRLELYEYDLRNIKFANMDLSKAEMLRCVFDGVLMRDCDFTETDLRRCSFKGVEFHHCTIESTKVREASFEG